MVDRQVQVLVVGGGLTGAALTLALVNLGYSTLLVEAKSFSEEAPAELDARSLALAPATVRVLEMLHVWPLLKKNATSIDKIHVSEQRVFGQACLKNHEGESLGYVVEMQHINKDLHQLIEHQNRITPATVTKLNDLDGIVTIKTPQGELTVQAELIVAADGAHSSVREWCKLPVKTKTYGQHAIVANIGLARGHHHEAYERFMPSGPLALLPMTGKRASLVWALKPADANRLASCSDTIFLKELQQAFGYRLGRFIAVGTRMIYPLEQVIMPCQVKGRVVFIGNAAHTLHPVAGQGFNLGLRDVAMLAQCITQHGLGAAMFASYEKARQHDHQAIIRMTDGLIHLFTSKIPGLNLMRGMGLMALDHSMFLKKLLSRYARGFAGVTPDLVCGIALKRTIDDTIV